MGPLAIWARSAVFMVCAAFLVVEKLDCVKLPGKQVLPVSVVLSVSVESAMQWSNDVLNDVSNDVFTRCVFERHDVKPQDHCSVPLEKTTFGGHAARIFSNIQRLPVHVLWYTRHKCPQFCGIGRSWMLNKLFLEVVPKKKSKGERSVEQGG